MTPLIRRVTEGTEPRSAGSPHNPSSSGARATVVDCAVPAALFLLGLPLLVVNYGPDPLLVVVHVLLCAVLVGRRRHSMTVFAVILAISLVSWLAAGAHVGGELGLFIAYYHVLVRRPPGAGLSASALFAVGIGVLAVQPFPELPQNLFGEISDEEALLLNALIRIVTALSMVLTALATGVLALVVRNRRSALAAAESEARRLRQERDQRARWAKEVERTRIAREMHDVVGHSLGVMISLSDGAVLLAEKQPKRAIESMATVAETGRAALAEVRDVLGLLRDEGVGQPYSRDVDELVDRVRATGLAVDMDCAVDLTLLPDRLRLCVFRIVQEALTNVAKHAGTDARAHVRVKAVDGRIRLSVTDNGTSAGAAGLWSEVGSGLTGLGERVSIQGGEIRTGPRPGGGWAVEAELPMGRSISAKGQA